MDRDELIGVPARAAARIAGIPERRLHRWEMYGLVVPRVHRQLSERNTVRIYDFDQLVELLVVKVLEDKNIHILKIQRCVRSMNALGHDRPLRQLHWAVDGEKLYVGDDRGNWFGGRSPRQGVLRETINLEDIRARVRSSVRHLRPADDRGRIEKRRGVLASKPVFAGTRTPVGAVQAYLARGATNKEILEAFPHLTTADIRAAKKAKKERVGVA